MTTENWSSPDQKPTAPGVYEIKIAWGVVYAYWSNVLKKWMIESDTIEGANKRLLVSSNQDKTWRDRKGNDISLH